MIQVEKHGNTQRLKAVCISCWCVFTFTESDAERDKDNDKLYLICPDCGKRFRAPERSNA